MNTISRVVGRSGSMFAALAFLVAVSAPAFVGESASAGQLTPRKITLSSSAPGSVSTDANGVTVAKGSGGNGAFAGHTYNWTFGTSAPTVNSIALQYCTTPLFNTACTAPTGLDAATVASIVAQTGLTTNDMTLDTTTVANTGGIFGTAPCSGTTPFRQNCILMKRAAAATAETGTPAVSYKFGQGTGTDWIKNPTSTGTFYVRIHVFSDLGYTTTVDDGGVAASIATQIDITAKVQEKLNFSVAAAPLTPTTSCNPLTGTGSLALGDAQGVLDIATAYDKHSYFRVNTNAAGGTNILYSGDTLKTKDGSSSITALTTTAVSSSPGTSQFGLAIDSSKTDAGDGHSFTNLAATAPYAGGAGTITAGGTALFAFDTTSVTAPKQIAGVSNQTIACDTGAVRYLGNISTTTRAGIYKTTITYIAVPTF